MLVLHCHANFHFLVIQHILLHVYQYSHTSIDFQSYILHFKELVYDYIKVEQVHSKNHNLEVIIIFLAEKVI